MNSHLLSQNLVPTKILKKYNKQLERPRPLEDSSLGEAATINHESIAKMRKLVEEIKC